MSDAPAKSRRSFLRGAFVWSSPEAPHDASPEPEPGPAAELPPEEAPLPMPWERNPPERRRPHASDGPRRPAIASTFQIAPDKCLAHRGQMCSVCRERCPIPGCITLTDHKPTITSDLCDGCGLCVQACPAPILALRFVPPNRSKPSP